MGNGRNNNNGSILCYAPSNYTKYPFARFPSGISCNVTQLKFMCIVQVSPSLSVSHCHPLSVCMRINSLNVDSIRYLAAKAHGLADLTWHSVQSTVVCERANVLHRAHPMRRVIVAQNRIN